MHRRYTSKNLFSNTNNNSTHCEKRTYIYIYIWYIHMIQKLNSYYISQMNKNSSKLFTLKWKHTTIGNFFIVNCLVDSCQEQETRVHFTRTILHTTMSNRVDLGILVTSPNLPSLDKSSSGSTCLLADFHVSFPIDNCTRVSSETKSFILTW